MSERWERTITIELSERELLALVYASMQALGHSQVTEQQLISHTREVLMLSAPAPQARLTDVRGRVEHG